MPLSEGGSFFLTLSRRVSHDAARASRAYSLTHVGRFDDYWTGTCLDTLVVLGRSQASCRLWRSEGQMEPSWLRLSIRCEGMALGGLAIITQHGTMTGDGHGFHRDGCTVRRALSDEDDHACQMFSLTPFSTRHLLSRK